MSQNQPNKYTGRWAKLWTILGWPHWGKCGRVVEVIAIVAATCIAIKATQTSEEAKTSAAAAETAAEAAKDHAETAGKTYELARKSHATAQQHSEAAQVSADSASKTAKSIQAQVDLARTANAISQKSAAASDKSAIASQAANAIAGQAKEAADISAAAASQANKFAEAANIIADKNADATKSANETALRAYVSVSGVVLDYTDSGATATVYFENTGRTFAHNLTAFAGMNCITTPGDLPPPIEPSRQPTPRSLGPNGKVRTVIQMSLRPGWKRETGKMQSWIKGTIRYTDQFGGDRHTNFQFVQIGTTARNGRFEVMYDKEGNDAD